MERSIMSILTILIIIAIGFISTIAYYYLTKDDWRIDG
jgi:hypothetical protein